MISRMPLKLRLYQALTSLGPANYNDFVTCANQRSDLIRKWLTMLNIDIAEHYEIKENYTILI